jgi:hypothetical protein
LFTPGNILISLLSTAVQDKLSTFGAPGAVVFARVPGTAFAARAAALLEHALKTAEAPAADRRAFIHVAGTAFPATLAFGAAVQPDRSWARWWRMWRERGQELVSPDSLLTGGEIAGILGIEPGPELGRAIGELTEAQVRGEVRTAGGARKWLQATLNR